MMAPAVPSQRSRRNKTRQIAVSRSWTPYCWRRFSIQAMEWAFLVVDREDSPGVSYLRQSPAPVPPREGAETQNEGAEAPSFALKLGKICLGRVRDLNPWHVGVKQDGISVAGLFLSVSNYIDESSSAFAS